MARSKKDVFTPARRQLLKEHLGLRGDSPYVFIEGLDSYETEYEKVCAQAKRDHRSLLRIIECDDKTFYDVDSAEQLRRFNLGGYTRVLFRVAGDIDFAKDESTSAVGLLNDKKMREAGTSVTGFMTVLEKEGRRHTVIVMRRATGDSSTKGNPEYEQATKIGALLHEIGHVDDYERSVTFKGSEWRIVDSEVYAHRFACKSMFARNYMLVLGYYLDALEKMAQCNSEYVKQAAKRVVEAPDFAHYRAAIAAHKEKMKNLPKPTNSA